MFEIFQYDFMVRAFLAGIMVACIAPLIGTFLVVRRLSLMAETLAHVSLLGVALGLLFNIQPIIAATLTAVIISLGIEKIRSYKNIFGESILALFLSGSLAVASILISIANGFNKNLLSYLFGSIATVTNFDLYLIVMLTIVVIITFFLIYKELFLVSFDDELAQVSGIKAKMINSILIILAAITVALSMRIVGILLIGALMVIPVVTAMQIAKSFRQILLYGIIFSLLSVAGGLFLSYYQDLAPGGTIVLIALCFFVITWTIKRLNWIS